MNPDTKLLLDAARAFILNNTSVTENFIRSTVSKLSESSLFSNCDQEDINEVIKRIQEEKSHTMDLGTVLKADDGHKKWVADEKKNITPYYWNRFKTYSYNRGFGDDIIGKTDIITTELLDLLQNPKKEGSWERKGLVVGHVQSGKTFNYTGLICKSLDAGYRLVIILAGISNTLRKQTQERIDKGVIGIDSSTFERGHRLKEKLIGVGKIDGRYNPVSLTTVRSDFDSQTANRIHAQIGQFNTPLIFVIKKNVSILKTLNNWLSSNNLGLNDYPLLLIDDEADHASINTNEDNDPTKTNHEIRKLLALFPKNVYLGYTATPFANIFIDPDTTEDMVNDLFPKNFIRTLEAPSNYLGGKDIFSDATHNIVHAIDDYHYTLPIKHKKDLCLVDIPESLKHAIRVFVLSCSIRLYRGEVHINNSMLINVSRFTDVQNKLRLLVHKYLNVLIDSINNYSKLSTEEALNSSVMKEIHSSWQKEYSTIVTNWSSIQDLLPDAANRIETIVVNSSSEAEKDIDYTVKNYPKGRSLIAVGGISLSRGLTLEGLSVSYFLRNSIMYDTLMQMGRWFGYRDGYKDICRIYMPEHSISWYKHISEATDELRQEFKRMKEVDCTPEEFGLAVRNHPESLIVTARNKMKNSHTVTREFDLSGRLIETSRLYTNPKLVDHNLDIANRLIEKANEIITPECPKGKHLVWRNIDHKFIVNFIESFHNHPESSLSDSNVLREHINNLAIEGGINKWNLSLINPTHTSGKDKDQSKVVCNYSQLVNINPSIRRQVYPTNDQNGIVLNRRKLATDNNEIIDLNNSNELREIPLLFLILLDCRTKGDPNIPLFEKGAIGYGINFPGNRSGNRIKKLVTYRVNTRYMQSIRGDSSENY